MKWFQNTLEIDIFEIMTMLIIFCRGEMKEKLELLFQLYCYNEKLEMNRRPELEFMINKICCSLGSTHQIKKSYLLKMIEDVVDRKIFTDEEAAKSNPGWRILKSEDKIGMEKFVNIMMMYLENWNGQPFGGLKNKINRFSL